MTENRLVYATFDSDEMLRESGRLPFAVLWPFVRSGHRVSVRQGLRGRLEAFYADRPGGLPETARLSLSMPGVDYEADPPASPESCILLFDRMPAELGRSAWKRRLHVGFDLFAPHRLWAPVIAPYAMHPSQALVATRERLAAWRTQPRHLRALFAGDSKGYVRNRVQYPGPKLPRAEVLRVLREGLGDRVVEVGGHDDIEALCKAGFVDRFVLSDSGTGIVPSQWLPTLAAADFFVCAPGIVMPMCHNVIEAMSVGTIPLIGYAEWFHPPLEHMRNCVVFDGREDLLEKMRQVLEMPASRVASMRADVIDYYEQHLRPEALVSAIDARPERELDVLIHTELNTARYAARLGPRSVLMRGPDADSAWRRLGRMIARATA